MSEVMIETMEDNIKLAKQELLKKMMSEVNECFDEKNWEINNFIESFFNELDEN